MSHKKKELSKIAVYTGYFFFRIGTEIFRILPLHAAYALGRIVARCVFYFDFKHSRRAVRHVLHSGIRTDLRSARELAYQSFVHMIKVFIEIVKFDQIVNEKNFYQYISIAKDPCSQKMISPETTMQIILATGHIGNWELAGGCHSRLCGLPMTSIGRPLANWKINEYFYAKRCSFQHHTFSKDKGLRPFFAAYKAGHTLTIVADQHASAAEGVEVTYFGHPARAHATPALLHLKTGTPISMPYLIRADDDFHFEFHCEEPFVYTPTGNKEEDVKAIVQKFTDTIERAVRKFPEQWLWAHRRWLDIERPQAKNYPQKETLP